MTAEEPAKKIIQCSNCKHETFKLQKQVDETLGEELIAATCLKCGSIQIVSEMSERDSSIWQKIGELGVNSGTVLICDPCYVAYIDNEFPPGTMPERPLHVVPDLKSLSLIEETIWFDHIKNCTLASRVKDLDPTGIAGVVATTGFGDGMYEIFAKITDYEAGGRRISEIRIRFDEAIGYDNHETKEIKHFTMSDMFQKVVERNRLEHFGEIIGRRIESLDDLTEEEAEKITSKLRQEEAKDS